jgi:hypothetical protein
MSRPRLRLVWSEQPAALRLVEELGQIGLRLEPGPDGYLVACGPFPTLPSVVHHLQRHGHPITEYEEATP